MMGGSIRHLRQLRRSLASTTRSNTKNTQNVDECKASPYPCAGGNKKGSFCVDYDFPQKFKCGCLPGYEAVLPNASDVNDNVVPAEWRPLQCVQRDSCVDFICHEDASCKVNSNNTPVCTCNDNLVGDGITSCSPPPRAVPAKNPPYVCQSDSYCNIKLENSLCIAGTCTCKKGFYQSNGKGQCISENQCANGFPNDCHKNAICTNTEGSYFCTCKDGYHDLNSNVKPGTVCAQSNECLTPSMNNCDDETQVCLDRPPPKKWDCVPRTPAPTPLPTPAPTPAPTLSPQERQCQIDGFKSVGLCIACSFLQFTAQDCESQKSAFLSNKGLTGRIPSEIGLLTQLMYMDLGTNQLTGKIPTEIGNLINLEVLYVDTNKLTGTIPTELANLSKLYYLYLQNNPSLTPPPSPGVIDNFCQVASRYCFFG